MITVFDYQRPIDQNVTLLEYRFNEAVKAAIEGKVQFETEESNVAPEPSVGCRVKADNGCEFALVYLTSSNRLLVFGERGVDSHAAIQTFVSEMPELASLRVH